MDSDQRKCLFCNILLYIDSNDTGFIHLLNPSSQARAVQYSKARRLALASKFAEINSVESLLIRCNSIQIFIYCKITLHISGVHRTHHQAYIKL